MYIKDKCDSIFELSPIVVKFADSHNFSTNCDFLVIIGMLRTLRRRVAFKNCNYGVHVTPFIFNYLPWW